MMPLNHVLRKCSESYKFNKPQEKVYHLIYMDDINLFAKNDTNKEITQRGYRDEIDIEKYDMLAMKSRKRQRMERIELLDEERIRPLGEKENYKYLGILEASTIKFKPVKLR